ncbi:MAG TPA: GNAT family N-acetyltransferase [Catenuloplanes sp.]
MAELVVRRADDRDLPELVRSLGQEHYFTDRVAAQRDGRGVLVAAFLGHVAVGDVYVRLEAADEEEVRRRLPGVPLLQHVEVHRAHRRRGIATRLIQYAEQVVREHGRDRVALGVDPENIVAVRLYRKLEFRDWGHGEVLTTREEHRPDGTRHPLPEHCHIFVKVFSRVAAEEAW